jgi:chromosome segregation protein
MMDNGAHFYKCDFQAHTPRDINWDGAGAVTDDERRQYAREFVASCRAKSIDAVGITDHHDLAFFRFIREAALEETDDKGQSLSAGDRLVVFPGMELTLGIPCQAILLFDAGFPVEFLPQALPALGITAADESADKHAQIQKLDIMSLTDLYTALDKLELLRGRFIVFPHVSDGGHKTLLRQGFEKHYVSMPCVGGYVDGPLPAEPKSTGMRSITNGQDKNWGNKAIGVFQTSDSRSRNFGKLGEHVTWVKWSKPTAEALRQACLSRHSRISHVQPRLPSIRLTRLEVSNSKFLGPIVIDFNPQYNAIIGGRGTGKSTMLEYMRWVLCDQPPSISVTANEDLPDYQRRRQGLIEDTLLPLNSVVDISFLLNDVLHVVRRKASGELTLRIGDSTFQACTEQNVRELLPIRAYSQKQLSAVGARLDELRRFVHAPIQGDLDTLQERMGALTIELKSAFDRVVRFHALQGEIAAHDIEKKSLNKQVEKLRASLKGLSPEDNVIIARQSVYEAEQRIVQSLERDANGAKQALANASAELKRLSSAIDLRAAGENAALLNDVHKALKDWIVEAENGVAGFGSVFVEPREKKALAPYFSGIGTWRERLEKHRAEYEQAKTRAAQHEATLNQIQELEARLAELNESTDVKSVELTRLGDPSLDFSKLRIDWRLSYKNRADLLEKQCLKLTALSKSKIRATLRRAADIAPLGEKLKQLTKGTKTRGERIDSLLGQISTASNPLDVWHGILDELGALAWVRVEDEATTQLPSTPRLESAGFTAKERMAVAKQLQPPQWMDLLLFDLKDLPVFEYQVRANDFLPFEKASPGQQATALLSILLFQEGPPLIIDQPEDDLNMKIINDIVETLWQAKSHRQVIFASHNANLVVNGDAELLICCDYRTTATESGGQIKMTGAIDVPEINSEITEVMEGGAAAFKLRYQKYGF